MADARERPRRGGARRGAPVRLIAATPRHRGRSASSADVRRAAAQLGDPERLPRATSVGLAADRGDDPDPAPKRDRPPRPRFIRRPARLRHARGAPGPLSRPPARPAYSAPARLDAGSPRLPIEETVGAIARWVEAGYVRHIGLSEAARTRSAGPPPSTRSATCRSSTRSSHAGSRTRSFPPAVSWASGSRPTASSPAGC